MSFTKRNILYIILALLVASCIAYYGITYYTSTKTPIATTMPTMVYVTPAETDQFVERIEALGTTQANESVNLTASVTEKVQSIHFDEGMFVNQGDILITLYKDEAEARLASAIAHLEEQKRELLRLKQLVAQKTIPQAEYDERATMHEIAQFNVAETEAQLAQLVIRAPFSGNLGLRQVSLGSLISPGKIITTLDDIRVIKLDFTIPARFLSALEIGLPIIAFTDAYQDKKFKGEITVIDSRVDPVSRSITARAELPNPDNLLKPGLLMTVNLITDRRQTLLVPEEALLPEQDNMYVLVVDADNTIHKQQITIGSRRPGEVEIVQGIEIGDLIVTRGTSRVRPGESVAVANLDELVALAEPADDII